MFCRHDFETRTDRPWVIDDVARDLAQLINRIRRLHGTRRRRYVPANRDSPQALGSTFQPAIGEKEALPPQGQRVTPGIRSAWHPVPAKRRNEVYLVSGMHGTAARLARRTFVATTSSCTRF